MMICLCDALVPCYVPSNTMYFFNSFFSNTGDGNCLGNEGMGQRLQVSWTFDSHSNKPSAGKPSIATHTFVPIFDNNMCIEFQ